MHGQPPDRYRVTLGLTPPPLPVFLPLKPRYRLMSQLHLVNEGVEIEKNPRIVVSIRRAVLTLILPVIHRREIRGQRLRWLAGLQIKPEVIQIIC